MTPAANCGQRTCYKAGNKNFAVGAVGGPTDIVLIVYFIVRFSLKLVYFVDLICCQAMVLDRSQDVPVAFIRLMISMLLDTACDTNIFLFYNNLNNYLLKCD